MCIDHEATGTKPSEERKVDLTSRTCDKRVTVTGMSKFQVRYVGQHAFNRYPIRALSQNIIIDITPHVVARYSAICAPSSSRFVVRRSVRSGSRQSPV